MSATVLKKINRRAKELVSKKGMSFRAAQKQAGREMRSVSGVKKKAGKRKARKVSGVKKKAVTRRVKKKNVGKAVGTVSHHLGQAKGIIKEQLGRKLLQKDMATTKTAKRKLGKEVTTLKKKLRALS